MPKLHNTHKVNLTLLKDLVKELEAALDTAEKVTGEEVADYNRYVIEMSKAQGIAAGVFKESSLLITDIQQVITYNAAPSTASVSSAGDFLDKLLKPLKGEGNKN